MADQSAKRTPNRHIVYCMKCWTPQEMLSTHLSRVCMKVNTPEERATSLMEAKKHFKDWAKVAMVFDYKQLYQLIPDKASRYAMMEHLESKGFHIYNKPMEQEMELPEAPASAASSTATNTATTAFEAQPQSSSSSSSADEGTSDPTCQRDCPALSSSVRGKMSSSGLYDKFADTCAILNGFKMYLKETLKVPNCQQEVDNVSRFLRYMQPTGDEPTLDFFNKSVETREYFLQLEKASMSPATRLNYIKNIIRFLDYLKNRRDLRQDTPDLKELAQEFKEYLQVIRKPISRLLSQKTVGERWNPLVSGQASVQDCLEILTVAKQDFLGLYGKLLARETLTESQKTLYRYYLEAVLVFQHCQRPGVVKGLTVQEYYSKKLCNGRYVIAVKDHKTSATQVATIALSTKEDAWFDAYYRHVRPHQETTHCDSFFLSHSGARVHKITNDIHRLHEMYKVQPKTSQMVRRAVETRAKQMLSTRQKEMVAGYMAHTNQMAETHYRMQQSEQATETAELLSLLSRVSPSHSASDSAGRSSPAPTAVIGAKRTFSKLLETFPVTVDGSAPPAKKRKEAGFAPNDRSLTDRWHKIQRDRRVEHLLSKFRHRQPSQKQFDKCVKRMQWSKNKPRYEVLIRRWNPPQKGDVTKNQQLLDCVKLQKWRGLSIKDFDGDKGKSVIANRLFGIGEIVSDYHGKTITAAEGRAMLQNVSHQMGYVFFYKDGQRDMCVDAQTFPCLCHPDRDTVGRRIHHSSKRANLKPVHVLLDTNGLPMSVILFKAAKNIKPGTELKFH